MFSLPFPSEAPIAHGHTSFDSATQNLSWWNCIREARIFPNDLKGKSKLHRLMGLATIWWRYKAIMTTIRMVDSVWMCSQGIRTRFLCGIRVIAIVGWWLADNALRENVMEALMPIKFIIGQYEFIPRHWCYRNVGTAAYIKQWANARKTKNENQKLKIEKRKKHAQPFTLR